MSMFLRRSPRRLVAALALMVLAGAARSAAARPTGAGQRPSSGGDRGLFVSVLDPQGRPVAGLGPSDFVVREDGIAREVVRAAPAGGPIDLAVLVDTSQSAGPYLPDVRLALHGFVRRMAAGNHVAIIGFGERPTTFTDYTDDVAALEKGVDRLFPVSGSGSYLLQAVVETCDRLVSRNAERGVIVAITAGGPEFSERDYQGPVDRVREAGVIFHALVLGPEGPNVRDFGQRNREIFLDTAAAAAGGQRVILLSSMAVDGALERLADELAGQYRVTYRRPDTLLPPKKVEVSVRRPGLTARAVPVPSRPR
jgi:VWFA-related protein